MLSKVGKGYRRVSLISACDGGHLDVVKLVVKYGFMEQSEWLIQNLTEALYDARKVRADIAKFLIEQGAKTDKVLLRTMMKILDIGLSLSLVSVREDIGMFQELRDGRCKVISQKLTYFLVDDLVDVVLGYSLWVT